MRESREEEYIRRMKALGYEPSLAGMDDGDIEWELARMGGGRREQGQESKRNVGQNSSGIIKDEGQWAGRNIPGRIIEGGPGISRDQPPVKIIIGGREYPAEIDRDGKIIIRF